jgi:ABC-type polysaccharide/polyol phosphate export permease
MWRTWLYLAYQDVGARYRRSLLGPFWIAAGTVAQATSMGIVFGAIFRSPVTELLPYIMGGLIVFNFSGIAFTDGPETFSAAASTIRAFPLPISFHLYRMIVRNLINVGHNLIVFFIVFLICRHTVQVTPLIVPGVILVTLFVAGASAITAVVGLRYRDIKFLLPYLWQIIFFATPVLWKADAIPKGDPRRIIFEYNPVYYLVEVVRRPLLGEPILPNIWPVSIGLVVILLPISLIVFSIYRKRIALWI